MTALGGRRGKAHDAVPPGVNGFWANQSFHNYADYALSADFRSGLDRLIAEGYEQRRAIMCSEAVWWRCHRRMITDYLIALGETVFHILDEGEGGAGARDGWRDEPAGRHRDLSRIPGLAVLSRLS